MNKQTCKIKKLLENKLPFYYDLPAPLVVTLLKYSENYTWLITDGNGNKTVLRVCRPSYHTKDELRSQLLWIHQLNIDTDIPMADVITTKNGSFFTYVEQYICIMFSFLNGHTVYNLSGISLCHAMESIGEIAAKLHLHVQHWQASRTLTCFTWNFEDFFGSTARWGDWSLLAALSVEQRGYCRQAIWLIKKKLEKYGKTPDRYGLIHSDLNIYNILIQEDTVYLIDFDDCGYGWYLLDLAMSLLTYDAKSIATVLLPAWLRGYKKFHSFSDEDLDMIPTFIVLRKIVRFGWIATHTGNDTTKKISTDDYIRNVMPIIKTYIKTKGTTFYEPVI